MLSLFVSFDTRKTQKGKSARRLESTKSCGFLWVEYMPFSFRKLRDPSVVECSCFPHWILSLDCFPPNPGLEGCMYEGNYISVGQTVPASGTNVCGTCECTELGNIICMATSCVSWRQKDLFFSSPSWTTQNESCQFAGEGTRFWWFSFSLVVCTTTSSTNRENGSTPLTVAVLASVLNRALLCVLNQNPTARKIKHANSGTVLESSILRTMFLLNLPDHMRCVWWKLVRKDRNIIC